MSKLDLGSEVELFYWAFKAGWRILCGRFFVLRDAPAHVVGEFARLYSHPGGTPLRELNPLMKSLITQAHDEARLRITRRLKQAEENRKVLNERMTQPVYEHFDWDHYQKVRAAKEPRGHQIHSVWHPLTGKHVVVDSRDYVVERVNMDWMRGWYYAALLRQEPISSHVYVPFENITCHDEAVLDSIDAVKIQEKRA